MLQHPIARLLVCLSVASVAASLAAADAPAPALTREQRIEKLEREAAEAAEAVAAVDRELARQFAELREEHEKAAGKLHETAEELHKRMRAEVDALDEQFKKRADELHEEYRRLRATLEQRFDTAMQKAHEDMAKAQQSMLEAREKFEKHADERTQAAIQRAVAARLALAEAREEGRPPQRGESPQPGDAPRPEQPQSRDEAIRHTLDRQIPGVNFNENALADILEFYSAVLGANMWVDEHALEAAGVKMKTEVTLKIDKPHPGRDSLLQVLKLAGADKIAMATHHDIVLISTPERLKVAQRVLAEANKRAGAPGARAELSKTLNDAKFDDIELTHIVQFLSDVLDSPIKTDWDALEKLQITKETSVNLRLRNCTLSEIVTLVFLSHPGGEAVTLTGGDDGLRIGVAEKP